MRTLSKVLCAIGAFAAFMTLPSFAQTQHAYLQGGIEENVPLHEDTEEPANFAPPPVSRSYLKTHVLLANLSRKERNIPLSSVAKEAVIVLNAEALKNIQPSRNYGVSFQNGVANPVLNLRVPFCTVKFVKKEFQNNEPVFYYPQSELVQRSALAPHVSKKVYRTENKIDPKAPSYTTMIEVESDHVEGGTLSLMQCMVDKTGQTQYREPTIAEIEKALGSYAKVYIKKKR